MSSLDATLALGGRGRAAHARGGGHAGAGGHSPARRDGKAQGIAPDVQVEQVELPEEPAAGSSATTRAPAALR